MEAQSLVTLSLTNDEALVLFEWLSREDGRSALPIEHPAEQKVLWRLEAQLERTLVEPFQADYSASVSAARERVLSHAGS
jgi:hypothetical protein